MIHWQCIERESGMLRAVYLTFIVCFGNGKWATVIRSRKRFMPKKITPTVEDLNVWALEFLRSEIRKYSPWFFRQTSSRGDRCIFFVFWKYCAKTESLRERSGNYVLKQYNSIIFAATAWEPSLGGHSWRCAPVCEMLSIYLAKRIAQP